MQHPVLTLYNTIIESKTKNGNCGNCIKSIEECKEFSEFTTNQMNVLYGEREELKQQTSARSFSVLEISKSRKGFQLKGKQLNQVAVQTLCILLDMNKHNATNQIGYPDSAEQRIAFGLSRDAPIISVYASSLFQTQSYYLLLLREIVQDCKTSKEVCNYVDEFISKNGIKNLLDVFHHGLTRLKYMQDHYKPSYDHITSLLCSQVEQVASILFHIWSYHPISFPHLTYLGTEIAFISSLSTPLFTRLLSCSHLLLLHAILQDIHNPQTPNAVQASSILHTLSPPLSSSLQPFISLSSLLAAKEERKGHSRDFMNQRWMGQSMQAERVEKLQEVDSTLCSLVQNALDHYSTMTTTTTTITHSVFIQEASEIASDFITKYLMYLPVEDMMVKPTLQEMCLSCLGTIIRWINQVKLSSLSSNATFTAQFPSIEQLETKRDYFHSLVITLFTQIDSTLSSSSNSIHESSIDFLYVLSSLSPAHASTLKQLYDQQKQQGSPSLLSTIPNQPISFPHLRVYFILLRGQLASSKPGQEKEKELSPLVSTAKQVISTLFTPSSNQPDAIFSMLATATEGVPELANLLIQYIDFSNTSFIHSIVTSKSTLSTPNHTLTACIHLLAVLAHEAQANHLPTNAFLPLLQSIADQLQWIPEQSYVDSLCFLHDVLLGLSQLSIPQAIQTYLPACIDERGVLGLQLITLLGGRTPLSLSQASLSFIQLLLRHPLSGDHSYFSLDLMNLLRIALLKYMDLQSSSFQPPLAESAVNTLALYCKETSLDQWEQIQHHQTRSHAQEAFHTALQDYQEEQVLHDFIHQQLCILVNYPVLVKAMPADKRRVAEDRIHRYLHGIVQIFASPTGRSLFHNISSLDDPFIHTLVQRVQTLLAEEEGDNQLNHPSLSIYLDLLSHLSSIYPALLSKFQESRYGFLVHLTTLCSSEIIQTSQQQQQQLQALLSIIFSGKDEESCQSLFHDCMKALGDSFDDILQTVVVHSLSPLCEQLARLIPYLIPEYWSCDHLKAVLHADNLPSLYPILRSIQSIPEKGRQSFIQTLSQPLASMIGSPQATLQIRAILYQLLLQSSSITCLDYLPLLQDAAGTSVLVGDASEWNQSSSQNQKNPNGKKEENGDYDDDRKEVDLLQLSVDALDILLKIMEDERVMKEVVSNTLSRRDEMICFVTIMDLNDINLLNNTRKSLVKMDRLERIIKFLTYIQQYGIDFDQSPYHIYFLQTLTKPDTFYCFFPTLVDSMSTGLPPALYPELPSPIETRQLLRLLQVVMNYVLSKRQQQVEIYPILLRNIVVFYKIVFNSMPPFTVKKELQESCQKLFIQLVREASQYAELEVIVEKHAPEIRRIAQI